MKHNEAQPTTTAAAVAHAVNEWTPDRKDIEIAQLRALVTRLTNVAQDLASGMTDPGTEALAAIHCGRHFIYG